MYTLSKLLKNCHQLSGVDDSNTLTKEQKILFALARKYFGSHGSTISPRKINDFIDVKVDEETIKIRLDKHLSIRPRAEYAHEDLSRIDDISLLDKIAFNTFSLTHFNNDGSEKILYRSNASLTRKKEVNGEEVSYRFKYELNANKALGLFKSDEHREFYTRPSKEICNVINNMPGKQCKKEAKKSGYHFLNDSILMPFIDGDCLVDIIIDMQNKKLNWNKQGKNPRVLSFQLLRILAYLQEQDINFNDMKPDNIMLRKKDGMLCLIDLNSLQKISDDKIQACSLAYHLHGCANKKHQDIFGVCITILNIFYRNSLRDSPQEANIHDHAEDVGWFKENIKPYIKYYKEILTQDDKTFLTPIFEALTLLSEDKDISVENILRELTAKDTELNNQKYLRSKITKKLGEISPIDSKKTAPKSHEPLKHNTLKIAGLCFATAIGVISIGAAATVNAPLIVSAAFLLFAAAALITEMSILVSFFKPASLPKVEKKESLKATTQVVSENATPVVSENEPLLSIKTFA